MQFDLAKSNYWIHYKGDNKYGRYIVIHKLILSPEPVLLAFCKKSHGLREFKLNAITKVEYHGKERKQLIEGMIATRKKGDF